MARPTVLLGMSGGVDSSVAAALLVDQGYEVVGVTMQESGVSRVVAVDIDEALRMREELAA